MAPLDNSKKDIIFNLYPRKEIILRRFIMADQIKGGLANGMSLSAIAKKHGVSNKEITLQFKMGTKVEMEHTDDIRKAGEIARDHLVEDPKYYSKLDKIERGSVK